MTPRNVYFVGAGGIGMAALERYYASRGANVAGYDRSPSPLTGRLIDEGIAISYDDDPATIPAEIAADPDTMVIYTPAVPADSRIMQWWRARGQEPIKRAAVLGHISRQSRAICFSGTHGKTTTSSMCAHILHTLPVGCNAFLGGILLRYNSNLMLSPTSPYTVVEADEYDRSFHHLRPWVAVVTAVDPDHLDIYGTEEAYRESYAHFTSLIQPGGKLLVHTGLALEPRTVPGVDTYTYGLDSGDFHAANIRYGDGTITFDLVYPGGTVADVRPGVPVKVNIENAIAAIAAAWLTGDADISAAAAAIATYPGVERRFQKHLDDGRHVVIDDYAHHPEEVRNSIESVRALYPGRRLTVVFQPHLYSRTRDFAAEFGQALSAADSVILTDIYPARELPIEGVTSQIILDAVTAADKTLISKEDFADTLENRNFDVLLTLGAGDMSFEVPELCRRLSARS